MLRTLVKNVLRQQTGARAKGFQQRRHYCVAGGEDQMEKFKYGLARVRLDVEETKQTLIPRISALETQKTEVYIGTMNPVL